jgi:hypothetical protein
MKSVQEIHNSWPLLRMCERFGLEIPPKGKFYSPFREDRNPSCEVRGQRIKDWSTGESFDAIDVFALKNGISNAEAIRRLGQEQSGASSNQKGTQQRLNVPRSQRRLIIPTLFYTPEMAEALSKNRGIPKYGIDFAANTVGSLGFAEVKEHASWLLTDGSNIAEARRMDGQYFYPCSDSKKRKSHTLAGSKKSFPIGLNPRHKASELAKLPILLVEGGPDYLAACAVALHMGTTMLPVAILGATNIIDPLALPFFKGRSVMILAHPDTSGVEGAKKWANQLHKIGVTPRVRELVGGDLNELVKRDGVEVVARGIK